MPRKILIENVTLEELQEIISTTVENVFKSLKPAKASKDVKMLTRKETADVLRISLPTLADWTRQGIINAKRLGGRVLYSESDIRQLLGKGGKRNV